MSPNCCLVKSVTSLLAGADAWCSDWTEDFSKTYLSCWTILSRRRQRVRKQSIKNEGRKKQLFNFWFKCIFRSHDDQHFIRFEQRKILIIPSYDHWLAWDVRSDYSFFKMQILVVRGTGCRVRELRWLYPCGCNQVLEAPACDILHCSFCCTNYLLCPHVELLLTHVQTLIFHIFFPGISIYSVTCARNTQFKLRMPKPCWCLPYVDLSWYISFLDFSDIFNITIPIWLLLLYIFQWEFLFCFSKVCHRDYP